jgi:hypothetical protein
MEQFSDRELKNAEILINEDQCLCTDGSKTSSCDKCPFRKGVNEQIDEMHQREESETIIVNE